MRYRIATAVAIVVAGLALLLPVVSYRLELPPDEGDPPARLEMIFNGTSPLGTHQARVVVSTKTDGHWQVQHGEENVLPLVAQSSGAARTFTFVGLALLLAGALAAFLRGAQTRAFASAAGALLGGAALFVAALNLRRTLIVLGQDLSGLGDAGEVSYQLGFWVCMGLLVAAAFGNLALAIMLSPGRAGPVPPGAIPAPEDPAEPDVSPVQAGPASTPET